MEIDDYIVADDHTLVEWALHGDDIAFEHLLGRYRDAIYRLFLQRTGSHADAEDLLQESFIKVHANLFRYNPIYTFGQWIYAIARNTFIDFVRKRTDDLSLSDKFTAPPSSSPNPEEKVIDDQERAALQQFLHNMPEPYRKLVVLRFLKGYSYEEISARLSLPLGTVKTRIHRAREQISRRFANEKP